MCITTCAASAGSYCYGDGDQDSGSSYIDATEDICPKNWRMPSLNWDDGDYDVLMQEYGNSLVASNINSLQYNLSTPLSGFFRSGSAEDQGNYGCFHSSTFTEEDYMWGFYASINGVGKEGDNCAHGSSLRCMMGS